MQIVDGKLTISETERGQLNNAIQDALSGMRAVPDDVSSMERSNAKLAAFQSAWDKHGLSSDGGYGPKELMSAVMDSERSGDLDNESIVDRFALYIQASHEQMSRLAQLSSPKIQTISTDETKDDDKWEAYLDRMKDNRDDDDEDSTPDRDASLLPEDAKEFVRQRNARMAKELRVARARKENLLAPGYYRWDGNELVRVRDAEPVIRYHGTIVPEDWDEGQIIERFEPKESHPDSVYRPAIGVTPAVYTTDDIDAALEYASNFALKDNIGEHQLYTLRISPNVHVNLGDCHNRKATYEAIARGADVIECPDFWEQPETLVLDPDLIEIRSVHLRNFSYDEHPNYMEELGEPKQIASARKHGILGATIYRNPNLTLEQQKPSLADAIADYKDAESRERNRGINTPMEYRGVSKEPSYRHRGGRGRMY